MSATKRGMVPLDPGTISLVFIPNTPFLKKNITAVTCIKGMIYSHQHGRKKDRAKVCNLLHLVKKNSQKSSREKKTLTAALSFKVVKANLLVIALLKLFVLKII